MRPTSICWPGHSADARPTRKIYCAGRKRCERELPEISGVTFFSSRRRVEEDEMPDAEDAGAIGREGNSLSNRRSTSIRSAREPFSR